MAEPTESARLIPSKTTSSSAPAVSQQSDSCAIEDSDWEDSPPSQPSRASQRSPSPSSKQPGETAPSSWSSCKIQPPSSSNVSVSGLTLLFQKEQKAKAQESQESQEQQETVDNVSPFGRREPQPPLGQTDTRHEQPSQPSQPPHHLLFVPEPSHRHDDYHFLHEVYGLDKRPPPTEQDAWVSALAWRGRAW